MYCVKCGGRVDTEASFCENCGHKLGNVVSGNTVIKTKKKKKYVIGVIGIIFVGVVFGLLTSIPVKKERSVDDDSYTRVATNRLLTNYGDIWEDEEEEEKEIIFDSNGVIDTHNIYDMQAYLWEGESSYEINGYGDVAIGHDDEGEYIFKIKNGVKTRIGKEGVGSVGEMQISYSGKSAAYVEGKKLSYVNLEKDEVIYVDENVFIQGFALSPSGKVVAYIGEYNSKIDNAVFLFERREKGTKITKIGENVTYILAVNDEGNAIFYIKEDGKLYFNNGKNEKCISKNTILIKQKESTFGDTNTVIFNEACTDVIYMDGTMVFIVK